MHWAAIIIDRMLTKPVRGRLSERGGLIQPSWGPLVLPTFVLGQAEYIPHSVRHSSLLTFKRGLTAPSFFRVISKVGNIAEVCIQISRIS